MGNANSFKYKRRRSHKEDLACFISGEVFSSSAVNNWQKYTKNYMERDGLQM
jgi:hypothetical protein